MWVDNVSGAHVFELELQPTAHQTRAYLIQMFEDESQEEPVVLALVALEKREYFNLKKQNPIAERYLRQLQIDVTWELELYRSSGENPYFAVRLTSLIDEFISKKGGGIRVVFDNSSTFKKRTGGEVHGFTTKLMNWRIRSGDLKEREVHFFPATKKSHRNTWVYAIPATQ